MSERVSVLGWGACVPGFASLKDWLAERPSAAHEKPEGTLVPLRDRRRASLLSRAFADAFAAAVERAGLDPSQVATVFGSSLGEVSTMIGLLEQMWREETTLSPMKFATSVHNAAAGLISIATGNRGFTTSLGADYDTPAMGLLEAIGIVQSEGRPVVVCCGDEAPPGDLVPRDTGWSLLCAALALGPLDGARTDRPQLSTVGIGSATLTAPVIPSALGRNPCVGLFDLVVALERGEEGVVRLDRGAGRGYSARIGAALP